MRLAGYFILGLAGMAWLAPAMRADDLAMASTAGNPYSTITERNVFALVPIPVVVPGSDVPPPDPPPKITIQGMMTIFDKPQVLFKFTPKALPGQPAKEVSLVLGEGERQEEVEVTKIDMNGHTASFINHGLAQEVPLSDTAKITGSVAAPAIGGGGLPMPAAVGGGGIPMPSAMAGGAGSSAASLLGRGGNAGAGNAANTLGSSSGTTIGGSGTAAQPGAATTKQALSPEAQVILMEAERARLLRAHDKSAILLPQTPLTAQTAADAAANP